MLRAALRRFAAGSTQLLSPCVPSRLTIRAVHCATPYPTRTLVSTNLTARFCRQAPTTSRTTFSTQWPFPCVSRIRFFSANSGPVTEGPLPVLSPRSVGSWLMVSSTLVFAIIIVGGVTRLTESGLSITEWKPVTGILPPLTHEEWVTEFDKYKGTPEFKMYVFACCTIVHSLYLT